MAKRAGRDEYKRAQILAVADVVKTVTAGTVLAGAVIPSLSARGSMADALTVCGFAFIFLTAVSSWFARRTDE